MPRRSLRSALTALVCLSWAGLADGLWAAEALVPQLALEVLYDNNIGLAERRADREADLIASAAGSLRQTLTLGPRSALTLRVAAKYHEFIDFSDLNRREFGAGARWYFQPIPGFTRPWYSLSVDWSALRHADSTIRDGALWRLGASTGRRFTDRVSGQLGYGYVNRGARRGEVFDLEQHRLFSALEWRLEGGATLYGNYSV
ncbi:MAG: hypothetical protein VX663_04065, partial [Pseudomonadota bacterium]|nr:hypothetical protein [Pseudomonadota bacterium]